MEKLIELLQEYLNSEVFKKDISGDGQIEDIPDVKLTKYFSDRFYCTYISDTELEISADTVISKRYGFIKWLVENDKIEREKFYDKARNIISDFDLRGEYEGAENEVLMLLSISEQPIELLLSVLK